MPIHDPLADTSWSTASTVAGFAASAPNDTLIQFAREELKSRPRARAVDIGCGAGRNAVPLARLGWQVLGIDLSLAMLTAAMAKARAENDGPRVGLALAAMDQLPAASDSFDLVVAHGIWNLASSGSVFRAAIREAARVAAPDAAVFVFLFSRSSFDVGVPPMAGETFVYTPFDEPPQCFLTGDQVLAELAAVGFVGDGPAPLRERNPRTPAMLALAGGPVIWEGRFRYRPQ